jgi:hypothetical protein
VLCVLLVPEFRAPGADQDQEPFAASSSGLELGQFEAYHSKHRARITIANTYISVKH